MGYSNLPIIIVKNLKKIERQWILKHEKDGLDGNIARIVSAVKTMHCDAAPNMTRFCKFRGRCILAFPKA
jgi:hypothetical protein